MKNKKFLGFAGGVIGVVTVLCIWNSAGTSVDASDDTTSEEVASSDMYAVSYTTPEEQETSDTEESATDVVSDPNNVSITESGQLVNTNQQPQANTTTTTIPTTQGTPVVNVTVEGDTNTNNVSESASQSTSTPATTTVEKTTTYVPVQTAPVHHEEIHHDQHVQSKTTPVYDDVVTTTYPPSETSESGSAEVEYVVGSNGNE